MNELLLKPYALAWKLARPLLRRHKRMAQGFAERQVLPGWPQSGDTAELSPWQAARLEAGNAAPDLPPLRPARLWLQAASGGEAYLALELLRAIGRELEREPGRNQVRNPAGEGPEEVSPEEVGPEGGKPKGEGRQDAAGQAPARPAGHSGGGLAVLCTSCTRQGMDVLRGGASGLSDKIDLQLRYFPLDEPRIMRRALEAARPALVALLETELWPGLLAACVEKSVPVFILNGRMTEKSFKAYKFMAGFCRQHAPRRILATAPADAARFAALFGPDRVGLMSNIKFDSLRVAEVAVAEVAVAEWAVVEGAGPEKTLAPEKSVPAQEAVSAKAVPTETMSPKAMSPEAAAPGACASLKEGAGQGAPVILLASVREEEEALLAPVLARLRREAPGAALVVAPRHMHRVAAWQNTLQKAGLPCELRSAQPGGQAPLALGPASPEAGEGPAARAAQIAGKPGKAGACQGAPGPASSALAPAALASTAFSAALAPGSLTLWDRFGDLQNLYQLASAVFVGGSLAPLGGQNFLEALAAGVKPCIGPHWSNFYWAGEELFQTGLARRVQSADELAPALLESLAETAQEKCRVRAAFAAYATERKGGAEQAARALLAELNVT